MKTRSAKNKGARLQKSVTLKFRNLFNGVLSDDDIKSQTMGMGGTDVVLSPSAKNLIPYDIECKNVEKLISSTMQDAIEQAEANSSDGRIPLLIFKSNNQPERVVLLLDDFLELVYPKNNIRLLASDYEKILIELEKLKTLVVAQAESS